jgi:hypothetical protein
VSKELRENVDLCPECSKTLESCGLAINNAIDICMMNSKHMLPNVSVDKLSDALCAANNAIVGQCSVLHKAVANGRT